MISNVVCSVLLSLSLAGPLSANEKGIACTHIPLVLELSENEGVPSELVLALIFRESTWDPKAISPAGACGLMQIIPRYTGDKNTGVPKLTCEELLDPEINIMMGIKTLRYWIHDYGKGDVMTGLCGYNAGFRCKGRDKHPGGMSYARQVTSIAEKIRRTIDRKNKT